MNDDDRDFYSRMVDRYGSGDVPWDDHLPPPEVLEVVRKLKPGRALDLGCGYGRASLYMAGKGWQVDGVDFVPRAIEVARERATEAQVPVSFHLANVSELDFLSGPYDFALDVGCCHSFQQERLERYRDHLTRLLVTDATYLLFSRLRQPGEPLPDIGPLGLTRRQILDLFSGDFRLESEIVGQTTVADQPTWPSGWFRWKRRSQSHRRKPPQATTDRPLSIAERRGPTVQA